MSQLNVSKMKENESLFEQDWLDIQDYELKILVMVAVLAQDHLAYRGTLADMCEFFGISNQTKNTAKIKQAIYNLNDKHNIRYIKEGYYWTLTLSTNVKNPSRIYCLQKSWVEAIKKYKSEDKGKAVDWINVLRVFVYLMTSVEEYHTYKTIGKRLQISPIIVANAITALDNIEFYQGSFKRKLKWKKIDDNTFKVIGQTYSIGFNWSK